MSIEKEGVGAPWDDLSALASEVAASADDALKEIITATDHSAPPDGLTVKKVPRDPGKSALPGWLSKTGHIMPSAVPSPSLPEPPFFKDLCDDFAARAFRTGDGIAIMPHYEVALSELMCGLDAQHRTAPNGTLATLSGNGSHYSGGIGNAGTLISFKASAEVDEVITATLGAIPIPYIEDASTLGQFANVVVALYGEVFPVLNPNYDGFDSELGSVARGSSVAAAVVAEFLRLTDFDVKHASLAYQLNTDRLATFIAQCPDRDDLSTGLASAKKARKALAAFVQNAPEKALEVIKVHAIAGAWRNSPRTRDVSLPINGIFPAWSIDCESLVIAEVKNRIVQKESLDHPPLHVSNVQASVTATVYKVGISGEESTAIRPIGGRFHGKSLKAQAGPKDEGSLEEVIDQIVIGNQGFGEW